MVSHITANVSPTGEGEEEVDSSLGVESACHHASDRLVLSIPKFSFVWIEGMCWGTWYKNDMMNGIFHPEYKFDDSVLSCIHEFLHQLDECVNIVPCHYGIRVAPSNDSEDTIIFRCHPSFHGHHWFD